MQDTGKICLPPCVFRLKKPRNIDCGSRHSNGYNVIDVPHLAGHVHLVVVVGRADCQVPLNGCGHRHVDTARQADAIQRVMEPGETGQHEFGVVVLEEGGTDGIQNGEDDM